MECKVQQPVQQFQDQAEYQALMEGLERSKFHKALILPLIERNTEKIVEIGCGNGVVLDLLAHNFRKSQITGIDLDPVMCDAARKRCLDNVDVLLTGATHLPLADESVDVVIYCSTIHEIYSHGGPHEVDNSLSEAVRVLKPGGSIIIRDTVKPAQEKVRVNFKKDWTRKRFRTFIKDYKVMPARYRQLSDGAVQVELDYFFEYLTKYFYEVGWHKEMDEIYGYFTKEEFRDKLTQHGLKVAKMHSYLLPFFEEKWSKDFSMDAPFPESTVIIKAVKGQ
ncbi:class I SAM-dependent methyltransferase [Dethiobacter alkaliphilus]|uniref:class I SAM-dependent methyltransferase n=1 Tax=Dethiobacter alkaliphilus TaxID=427926 RepID=UPI0022279C77|nr:class I SAM-dependent methyltransferase [Dethiobacter alkaliphilus]MCW3491039.1 methyltransferase domain-containing protein [Dethiobacter alkaliphilus]